MFLESLSLSLHLPAMAQGYPMVTLPQASTLGRFWCKDQEDPCQLHQAEQS